MSDINGHIRVFLLDDHEEVRQGLKMLLDAEADLEVVGEAATASPSAASCAPPTPTSSA